MGLSFPRIKKFLCCFSLHKGLLISTVVTGSIWLFLVILYLPYELFLSKSLKQAQHIGEVDEATNSHMLLNWRRVNQLGIILILFLLFTDCLLLVGIRRKNKPKPDMMVPWLFLYSLLIPTLIILSVANVIISNDNIISIILILPSPIFSYLWLSLYSYRYSVLRNDNKTCDAGNNSLPYQYIPVLQNELVEENK